MQPAYQNCRPLHDANGHTFETCTPRPRWMPAQRMQMKTPVLMEAQLARAAPPPPMQSAHCLLCGRSKSFFRAASCCLFSSMVTPFISPAFLQNARSTQYMQLLEPQNHPKESKPRQRSWSNMPLLIQVGLHCYIGVDDYTSHCHLWLCICSLRHHVGGCKTAQQSTSCPLAVMECAPCLAGDDAAALDDAPYPELYLELASCAAGPCKTSSTTHQQSSHDACFGILQNLAIVTLRNMYLLPAVRGVA